MKWSDNGLTVILNGNTFQIYPATIAVFLIALAVFVSAAFVFLRITASENTTSPNGGKHLRLVSAVLPRRVSRVKGFRTIYAVIALLLGLAFWQAYESRGSLLVYLTPDRDCSDFRTWREAQDFFQVNKPGDRHLLDEDNDGIACEWRRR